MLRRRESGDTIVEVLFAVTIFSLVAVSGLSIMNQGLGMAQRSLEIGLVRQQIDMQADALRYLNNAYVSDYGKRGAPTEMWQQTIAAHAVNKAQDYSAMINDEKCQLPSTSGAVTIVGSDGSPFVLDISKLSSSPGAAVTGDAATYAQVLTLDEGVAVGEGLWIQAVKSPSSEDRPGFYDFHIRACWRSPGQVMPLTLGTIVRLYEPRG